MKKMVKILSLVMAIAMVCTCMVGCGDKSQSGSNSGKIVIGSTGPLTGDASSYGISVKQGAQLAIDEINAAGGLNGNEFSFIMKDDKASPEDAQTAYDQLMDEGMQISIGSVTSGSCVSFAAKSVEDNLFFITPSASSADVIVEDNAFRVCFGDPQQGTIAAQELVNKGYKNIGCLYDTSDTYSQGIFEAFDAEMKKLNAKFVVKTFDAENNKDFSTQADALKDCDAVFFPFYYTEAGLAVKALTDKGSKAYVLGADGLDGIAGQVKDSKLSVTVDYITPFDVNSKDEKVAKFVNDYKAKYNAEPDQFAADGYDAIYALYEAMKDAGVKDSSISASDLCELVKESILKINYSGVTGKMTWNKDGSCEKSANIVSVK